jgi:type II secretory pathway pseudopilin PulG
MIHIYYRRFTLMELLIAMALSTFLMTAIVGIFSQATDIFNKSRSKVEVYQNGRTTLKILERDLMGVLPYSSQLQEFVVNINASGHPSALYSGSGPASTPFLAFTSNTSYIDATTPPTRRVIGPAYIRYHIDGDSTSPPYYQIIREVQNAQTRAFIGEEAIGQFILPDATSAGQPMIVVDAITAPALGGIVSNDYIQGGSLPLWHAGPFPNPANFLPRGLRFRLDLIDPQNREVRSLSSTFWIPAATIP